MALHQLPGTVALWVYFSKRAWPFTSYQYSCTMSILQ